MARGNAISRFLPIGVAAVLALAVAAVGDALERVLGLLEHVAGVVDDDHLLVALEGRGADVGLVVAGALAGVLDHAREIALDLDELAGEPRRRRRSAGGVRRRAPPWSRGPRPRGPSACPAAPASWPAAFFAGALAAVPSSREPSSRAAFFAAQPSWREPSAARLLGGRLLRGRLLRRRPSWPEPSSPAAFLAGAFFAAAFFAGAFFAGAFFAGAFLAGGLLRRAFFAGSLLRRCLLGRRLLAPAAFFAGAFVAAFFAACLGRTPWTRRTDLRDTTLRAAAPARLAKDLRLAVAMVAAPLSGDGYERVVIRGGARICGASIPFNSPCAALSHTSGTLVPPHGVEGTSTRSARPRASWGRCEPSGTAAGEDQPGVAGRTPGGTAWPRVSRTGSGGPARVTHEVGRRAGGRPRRVVPRGTADAGPRPFVSGTTTKEAKDRSEPSLHAPSPRRSTSPRSSARCCDFWREQQIFEKSVARNEGARDLDVLRGPAHRQRPPGHPPHRGADVQGRLPALPHDAGLPGQPQGRLGLPRPPGRARGREGARLLRQGRHRGLRHRRVQRPLPRVGAALRRPLGADDRPDGLLDRHARSLPDDGRRVRRVGLVGPASRSTARDCSSRTTASRRTAPAAAPASPTTSSPRATRRSPTPRSTCASPSPPARTPAPRVAGASLLVWTTTPWTLVSNALVAAHPEMTYVTASNGEETLVVAESLVEQARPCGARAGPVGDRFTGADMVGWTYQRPFELVEWPARTDERDLPDAHFVVNEDYVTAEDGTGLVHQSPAFGEDDFAVLPAQRRRDGQPDRPARALRRRASPLVGGQFFRHANTDLVADLTQRGLLFRHVPYEHSYPHCWRCHTALLYYAQPSWYVRTTQIKDDLLRENENTNWFPVDDQARPLRRLAGQQHRLGALPQPLLGHAAADLALRRGPPDLRRLAGRALRADRHRPVRPRPPPALRRRRDLRLSHRPRARVRTVRRAGPAGPRGDRRVVRLRLDAVRAVGLPARRGLGGDARAGLPGRLHLRGDRPDPRLVLHADGGRHAGLRRSRRTATCSAWATSWPRTAARCPSTSATSSSRSR